MRAAFTVTVRVRVCARVQVERAWNRVSVKVMVRLQSQYGFRLQSVTVNARVCNGLSSLDEESGLYGEGLG